MTRRMSRRRYVGVTAGLGLVTVAGCADAGPGNEEDPNGNDTESGDDDPEAEGDGEGTSGDDEAGSVDHDHESVEGDVRFVVPEDGGTVSDPVDIELEVEGIELVPTDDPEEPPSAEDESEGENASDEAQNSDAAEVVGHLHVIVDEGCVEPGVLIPFEENYHHLSEGGTDLSLELESGEYDLCAQVGDDGHVAYDVTDEITIEVGDDGN